MSREFSPEDPWDASDDVLLSDLARVLADEDPVPDGLVDRALFALTLEGLRAEVAQMERLGPPATAVRGPVEPDRARTITFTTDQVTAMITLSPAAGGAVRIDGWAAPASTFVVELHRPGGGTRTESDADGRFVFDDVARGPASLVLRADRGAGAAVSTPVVEI